MKSMRYYSAISKLVTRRNEILPLLNSSSSLPSVLKELRSHRSSNPQIYHEILTHDFISKNSSHTAREFADNVIEVCEANLDPKDLVSLYNTMIKQYTREDFSTSAIYRRKIMSIENGEIDFDARIEIMKYNPGRVQSSWDMYLEAVQNSSSPLLPEKMEKLHIAIVEKLLLGDASQIEDNYVVTVKEMAKVLTVIRGMPKALPYDLESRVVNECARLNLLQALRIIKPRSSIAASLLNDSSVTNLSSVWEHVRDVNLSTDAAIHILSKLIDNGELEEDFNCLVKEMRKLDPFFNVSSVLNSTSDALRSFIEYIKGRDMDKGQQPIKMKMRKEILRTIGTRISDLPSALEYFDASQDKELLPIMASVWAYHAVKEGEISYMEKAEKCLEREEESRAMATRILGYGGLGNVQKSLDLYNEHINNASKSTRMLMTESLVLSFLSNGDREFAQLIESGAISNGLIDASAAKSQLKPLFKLYGDACEAESGEGILRQQLLIKLATVS